MSTARHRVGAFVVYATLAASAAAVLAPLGWPFELFAHFRWQLAVAGLLSLLLAAMPRRPVLLIAAVIAALLQVIAYARVARAAAAAEPAHAQACQGPEFRVVTLNLWYRSEDPGKVLRWLREHPADVVVLQEVTPQWAEALDAARSLYAHRYLHPRDDPYGLGILSRVPLEQVRTLDLAGDGLPSASAVVRVGGRALQVVNLHTRWPVLPDMEDARDRALDAAADLAADSSLPTVLAGDFNLTPYAPEFADLVAESRLDDALAGEVWRPTWRASTWPLALPIDHVLVPESTCVVAAAVGEDVGSDHRPVAVTLRWR